MTNKANTKSRLSRRSFIKGAAGLGVLAAAGCFLPQTSFFRSAKNSAMALTGDLQAMYLRQLITANAANSRRIMWQSDTPLENPGIEYRAKDSSDSHTVTAAQAFFTDDGTENLQYDALLTGLKPGQKYEYRVTCKQGSGDWHPLATPQEGAASYKMLVFPDSQSSDYSDWEKTAQSAWQRNPDACAFINMGDIVDNGEDSTQWHAWFNAVNGMKENIPFIPLMGNHETYNKDWKVRLPEAYLNYFHTPANNSQNFERYYYSFDYGDVHFIVLNSQWDEIEDFKAGLKEEQISWFREDVQKSTAKWKILLIHKDVLQYRIHRRPERQEGISDLGKTFMPLCDELGIDIVFTAHLHTYRNRGHLYNLSPSDKGPLYILTGVAGNVRYPGLWIDHAYDKVTAPQPETDNYLTLEVTPDQLTVACFLPDGQEIDRVSVRK